MVKKKEQKQSAIKSKDGSIKQFLIEVYTKDCNIANDKVLKLVLSKFVMSKASIKTVLSWKKELRAAGVYIPKQRVGAKVKAKQ